MTRFRAAATHFGLSMLVVGTVFLLVYFVWYPEPLFRGAGGRDLFLVLALVDVTIGPLITLVIFKPGKPGLKFDLVVIAVLQLAALAYGSYVVFEARPAWIVYLRDRFDLVRANQVMVEEKAPAKPQYARTPLSGPQVVGARVPTDPDERFRMMVSGLAGADVSSYPRYFVPYEELAAEAAAKAKPIRTLRTYNPGREGELATVVAKLGGDESRLAFLPLRAGKTDLSVVLEAKTGKVLAVLDLRPWQY
ncbi:MAG TPA: TfpX/TfpZ family type IV pilin accessory protein [Usitatibacter sp.]|nr:TfpX/TfpZ family type IV pilin accessory protein [Usitatibacter sp.]